jgi:hypothetical protein
MKRTRGFQFLVFLIAFFASVALSVAGNPKSKPFLPKISPEWTQITPEPTEYMGRSLCPTCIGLPGTNSEYSFFVKGGKVNNVVVFFDGGGACWESMNTIYYPTCYVDVGMTAEDLAASGGIFDTDNPANPFKEWSYVFIPYCTGDLHWGSGDYDYPDYMGKYGGGTVTAHHRGFDNFLVVLKWITENFKKPHQIFVAGSSAGSYGAMLGFPYIQEAYPKAKVSLLGDAGNGVISEDFHTDYINHWNFQDNLPDWIPGFDRPFAEYTISDMYLMIADHYRDSKVAQYTTAWDATQTYFYNVMLNISEPQYWDAWLPVWCDWHEQMMAYIDASAAASNYRYYVGAGMDHTILRYDKFYQEESAGVPFVKWVDAMVRSQGGRHGKGKGAKPWQNAECWECLDPLVCP